MNPTLIDAPAPGGARAAVPLRPRSARVPTGTENRGSAKSPWWMWPHLLGLDAPLVALVWQRWLAQVARVALPPSRAIILGLGVWLIYLADRLADSARSDDRRDAAPRHVFAGARRQILLPMTLLVAAALIVLTPSCLPASEFLAGLGLLGLALGYFWLIHCWPIQGWAAFLPKEAAVGTLFGAGTAFFIVCRSPGLSGAIWLGMGLFGAVCFLNCALITRWERHAHDLHERSSLLNAFPRLSARLGMASVLLAMAAVAVCCGTGTLVAAPVAASALLLASLDRLENRLSTDALRVLADLVLLTPWLTWALLPAAA